MSPERIESLRALHRRLERALSQLQASDRQLIESGRLLSGVSEARWDLAFACGYLDSWIDCLEGRPNG